MNIIICEDDLHEAHHLRKLFLLLPQKDDVHIRIFTDGMHLLDALHKGMKADLLCMDIYLANENGIAVSKQVRYQFPKLEIAFLTTSEEYAIEAFALDALHYIKKPITMQALQFVLKRYTERKLKGPAILTLTVNERRFDFNLSDLIRIESSRKGIDVFLYNRQDPIHITMTFARMEEQITINAFAKISRGIMLYLGCISYIHGTSCNLRDGTVLSISRRRCKQVKQQYYDFIKESQHYQL